MKAARPVTLPQAALSAPGALAPSSDVLALHEKLVASASATAVLRQVFGDPVEIQRMPAAADLPDATLCARLSAAAHAIIHRRVTLRAAGRAVSEADLWYVPSRLEPGMAAALAATNTPFGIIVAPLQPSRELTAFRFGQRGEPYALEHHAVLRDGDGQPIAAVHERYLRIALM